MNMQDAMKEIDKQMQNKAEKVERIIGRKMTDDEYKFFKYGYSEGVSSGMMEFAIKGI